jgi:hypothetical protein
LSFVMLTYGLMINSVVKSQQTLISVTLPPPYLTLVRMTSLGLESNRNIPSLRQKINLLLSLLDGPVKVSQVPKVPTIAQLVQATVLEEQLWMLIIKHVCMLE